MLQHEYQTWFEGRPEALESSAQYERAQETAEQLATVVDLLLDIEPPRGYGRD